MSKTRLGIAAHLFRKVLGPDFEMLTTVVDDEEDEGEEMEDESEDDEDGVSMTDTNIVLLDSINDVF